MNIKFHYDIEKIKLRDSKLVKKIIGKIIRDAEKKAGNIDIIFTGDEKVYEINREFLGHDYYTDVIAFDYSKGKTTSGEIYISIDRVKENAGNYNVTKNSEIRRVIFHGILHLCGYDDRTNEERKKMTEMEEMYLDLSYAE